MKYLLDTHILIWWLLDDPQLTPRIKEIIQNNDIYVSDISIWEIVIKRKKGKLSLEFDTEEMFLVNDFKKISITTEHIIQTEEYEFLHSDPFDRMLVAQSHIEKMPLITKDSKLFEYPIEILQA